MRIRRGINGLAGMRKIPLHATRARRKLPRLVIRESAMETLESSVELLPALPCPKCKRVVEVGVATA